MTQEVQSMISEHVPDIHERGEARCEAYVVSNKVRCCNCETLCNPEDVISLSEDPYSPPVCPACADVIWGKRDGKATEQL